MTSLLARGLGVFVALAAFAMMAVTCVDVVGRYVFTAPLPGAVEINELLLGLMVFGALPLVTAGREHVSIGLLDNLFRGAVDRVRQALLNLVSGAVIGITAYRLWLKADELAANGDTTLYLRIPAAPFGYFMSLAAAVTTLILLIAVLRAIVPANRGES